jgi:hypothetical protein
MKTAWASGNLFRHIKKSLRSFLHHMLVDVIPFLLLLAAMAYGMAMVSTNLSGDNLDRQTVSTEKPS